MSHNRKPYRKLRSLHLWHRHAGYGFALFVLCIAVTGLLLNHSERLGLDERTLRSPRLLQWYGIAPAEGGVGYRVGKHLITLVGEQLFFDEQTLAEPAATLHGAVRLERQIAVALPDRLLLLSEEGELIDIIDALAGLPAAPERIGLDEHGRLVLQGGTVTYVADDDSLLNWTVQTANGVRWSRTSVLDEQLERRLRDRYQGSGISAERLLLELHTGRIFGGYGWMFADLIALALIFSTASGLSIALRRRRKQQ